MWFYDRLGVFKPTFGDLDFFRCFHTHARPATTRLMIELWQNHQKTSKIHQKSWFLLQNDPNSCRKIRKSPLCSALIMLKVVAIDSAGFFGPKNTPHSKMRFSWFLHILSVNRWFEILTTKIHLPEGPAPPHGKNRKIHFSRLIIGRFSFCKKFWIIWGSSG